MGLRYIGRFLSMAAEVKSRRRVLREKIFYLDVVFPTKFKDEDVLGTLEKVYKHPTIIYIHSSKRKLGDTIEQHIKNYDVSYRIAPDSNDAWKKYKVEIAVQHESCVDMSGAKLRAMINRELFLNDNTIMVKPMNGRHKFVEQHEEEDQKKEEEPKVEKKVTFQEKKQEESPEVAKKVEAPVAKKVEVEAPVKKKEEPKVDEPRKVEIPESLPVAQLPPPRREMKMKQMPSYKRNDVIKANQEKNKTIDMEKLKTEKVITNEAGEKSAPVYKSRWQKK
jgi:hypothetical protein